MSEHETVHRRRRRESGGIRQLPWRRLVNPYRPVEILSEDQVETIHRASLRILAEICALVVCGLEEVHSSLPLPIDLVTTSRSTTFRKERRTLQARWGWPPA